MQAQLTILVPNKADFVLTNDKEKILQEIEDLLILNIDFQIKFIDKEKE